MEGLHVFLLVLAGVFLGHNSVCGSVVEVTAKPGENITLYCDCKPSLGVYIVWFRNCSHKTQPPLVLKMRYPNQWMKPLPLNFHFVRNKSSESYDLLIQNITVSHEGFYYCGNKTQVVQKVMVNKTDYLLPRDVYSYGNATRIIFNSGRTPLPETPEDRGVSLSLLLSLCSAVAVVSSLISSLVVYCLCRKKAEGNPVDQQRLSTKDHSGSNQDEELCYATVKIKKTSQRSKRTQPQSSDFSTYSAIKTSQM